MDVLVLELRGRLQDGLERMHDAHVSGIEKDEPGRREAELGPDLRIRRHGLELGLAPERDDGDLLLRDALFLPKDPLRAFDQDDDRRGVAVDAAVQTVPERDERPRDLPSGHEQGVGMDVIGDEDEASRPARNESGADEAEERRIVESHDRVEGSGPREPPGAAPGLDQESGVAQDADDHPLAAAGAGHRDAVDADPVPDLVGRGVGRGGGVARLGGDDVDAAPGPDEPGADVGRVLAGRGDVGRIVLVEDEDVRCPRPGRRIRASSGAGIRGFRAGRPKSGKAADSEIAAAG